MLQARNWFRFHNQDAAIEAVIHLLVGIAFAFMHRERRSVERFNEAMERVNDLHNSESTKVEKASG
jgi:hypothetical protein